VPPLKLALADKTAMTQLILFLVSLFKRHIRLILFITFITMAAGIVSDRFVGGAVAWIAGRVQFIALVTYVFLMLVYLLFRKHASGEPMSRGRKELFVLLAVAAGYFVSFTTVEIVKYVS